MKLCEKLSMLRKERGYSQEDLAEKIGVSRQAVSRWEQGISYPDAINIVTLSSIFDVSCDYLLKEDEDNKNIRILSEGNSLYSKNSNFYIGLILLTISVLVLVIVSIYGSVVGGFISIESQNGSGYKIYKGLSAFLYSNNLWWIMAFAVLGTGCGIILIYYDKLKPFLFGSKNK